jgi:hypothetical protein
MESFILRHVFRLAFDNLAFESEIQIHLINNYNTHYNMITSHVKFRLSLPFNVFMKKFQKRHKIPKLIFLKGFNSFLLRITVHI